MRRVTSLSVLLSCVACSHSAPRLDGSPACEAAPIDLLGLEIWEPPPDLPAPDAASIASGDHPIPVPDAGLYALPDGVLAMRCGERDAGEPDNDCELVIASGGRVIWQLGLFSDAESTPSADTFSVFTPALFDVTGDGRPELVLTWRIMGEPLPAVGPQATHYLAIVTAPTPGTTRLDTLYGPVPTEANGAGGLDYCEARVELRVCDGRPVIDRTRRCQAAICVDAVADEDLATCPGWAVDVTRAIWSGERFE